MPKVRGRVGGRKGSGRGPRRQAARRNDPGGREFLILERYTGDHRMTSPASALAIVSGLLLAGPAAAQVASVDSRNSPSSLRCSALGQIDEAERPAAIHFMAGYSSGE